MTDITNTIEERPAINALFTAGLDDKEIAKICEVSPSAVNKWRNNSNGASRSREALAAGYLRGMLYAEQKSMDLPEAGPEPQKEAGLTYLVTIDEGKRAKFEKVMLMFGFEFLNMDED